MWINLCECYRRLSFVKPVVWLTKHLSCIKQCTAVVVFIVALAINKKLFCCKDSIWSLSNIYYAANSPVQGYLRPKLK